MSKALAAAAGKAEEPKNAGSPASTRIAAKAGSFQTFARLDQEELIIEGARAGCEQDIERLVLHIKDDVFNLALRMLGNLQEAEDATQEILMRVVGRLDRFQAKSRFSTWVYRVAANYLVDHRRVGRREQATSFEAVGEWLDASIPADAESLARSQIRNIDEELLEQEVFLGCTLGMLLCLDRDHRLAFVLGAIFELDSQEAAEVLDVTPATFRKRVSRSRHRLQDFLESRCGVISVENPCSCSKQLCKNVASGKVQVGKPGLSSRVDRQAFDEAREHLEQIGQIIDTIEMYRSQPAYSAPESIIATLKQAISSERYEYFR